MKELTPDEFRCLVGSCPRIFETDEGELLLIGKEADLSDIPEGIILSEDEKCIVLPKGFIKKVIK